MRSFLPFAVPQRCGGGGGDWLAFALRTTALSPFPTCLQIVAETFGLCSLYNRFPLVYTESFSWTIDNTTFVCNTIQAVPRA